MQRLKASPTQASKGSHVFSLFIANCAISATQPICCVKQCRASINAKTDAWNRPSRDCENSSAAMRLEQVRKLDGWHEPDLLEPLPRPKGMRRRTFLRLRARAERPRSVPIPASSLITDIDLGTISDRSPGTIGTGYVSSERGTVLTPIDTETAHLGNLLDTLPVPRDDVQQP